MFAESGGGGARGTGETDANVMMMENAEFFFQSASTSSPTRIV